MVPSRAGEFRELGGGTSYDPGSVLRLRKCVCVWVCVLKLCVFAFCLCM